MDPVIERLIHSSNPHWKGNVINEKFIDREVQGKLLNLLDKRQIICLLGPRRSGKTTLLKILMKGLLDKGTPPKQVFYISFDELMATDQKIMSEMIDYYFDKVSGEGKAYLFLDEIHNIDFWQTILKRHYDVLHPRAKFVVTGSSSFWLKMRSRESLTGRSVDQMVWPLSFREFLAFRKLTIPPAIGASDYLQIERYWNDLGPARYDIIKEFERFLLYGGFPEMAIGEESLADLKNYLWTYVVEKTILRDLSQYFPVENPKVIVEILRILAGQSSRLISYQNLAETLGLKAPTVSKYLSYLELGYIVGFTYNYTKSKVKQVRTSKKAYITDTGLITALTHLEEEVFSHPDEVGLLVETIIRNHFARLTECYFWRDEHKNEVDLVARYQKSILPIEVKYTEKLTSNDLKGIRLFNNHFKTKRSLIVTKSLLKDFGETWAIPAPLLLLLDFNEFKG